MLDAIIFDFDGVICESVDAKTEAFRKLFQGCPEHLDKIIQFHIVNGGMSRYEKFKVIYRDFLKVKLTEEEARRLGQRFTEYSYDSVVNSAFVKGAHEFLNKYYKRLPLFVVSGTPQEEMISVIMKRKLNHFFQGAYGSPQSKSALIMKILSKGNFDADKVVFVGDSINDYIGADQAGVRFIGRVRPKHPNPFVDLCLEKLVEDLAELDKWIEGENVRWTIPRSRY